MSVAASATTTRDLPSLTAVKPFGSVLCVLGAGTATSEAVRQAAIVAGRDATLTLVCVAVPPAAGRRTAFPDEIEALARASTIAASLGVRSEVHVTEAVDRVDSLLALCSGHDLLVVDAGEDAFALAAAAPIPVLVARRPPPGTRFPDSILVAVDGSSDAHRAVARAADLAARHAALVAIVASPERDAAHRVALAADAAAVAAATGAAPVILDEEEPAATAIVFGARSLEAALVVIASRRLPTGAGVSADVVRRADCSVLVVRSG
jgi:nucleotide-binding universal stress UspA family protein